MSRQDRATTERHTKTLREILKRPENKLCADCKRNDPRWASWNLGVYLCIRCSGIHRGMGTHISKVKSVDLDTWTPEQMQSIQGWGNYRANLYWEAHLKPGHSPPEHKMESFVRSKYESRRWAMEGPPPEDPSVLEQGGSAAPASAPEPAPVVAPQPRASQASVTTRQPQPQHALLSSSVVQASRAQKPVEQAQAPVPVPAAPANDLFQLDFHAPSPPAGQRVASLNAPKKDVKQDILSLFAASAPAPAQQQQQQFGQFASSPWGASAPAASSPPVSMAGTTGAGQWGASSGWAASPPAAAAPAQNNLWGTPGAAPAQSNTWGTPAPAQNQWGTQQPSTAGNDLWGAAPATSGGSSDPFGSFGGAMTVTGPPKTDDAFGDLWGGFK